MKKFFLLMMFMVAVLIMSGSHSYAALTANSDYTITIQKVNSNGTTSDYSSTTAKSDANGKLTFTASGMPTDADSNFFVFIIKDANGNVVRRGFVPAPHAGATNQAGVNDLSTAHANAILAAAQRIGSDDPIPIAYLITLLRSPGATSADAQVLAALGADAITGTNGFEGFLTSNGVNATQLAAFKKALIYNAAGGKTIVDLTKGFKDAVDSGDATQATQLMQKAGGQMADVFMAAATAAGIDHNLILAAHDAAGDIAENPTNTARQAQLSSGVRTSMGQSMDSFFQRIAGVKVKEEYTKALSDLNATGSQVDRFVSAVTTMLNGMASIESTYGDYFMNPAAYIAAHPGTTEQSIRTAIDTAFTNNFITFQTNITSTDADISAMKTAVVAAMQKQFAEFTSNLLPQDFGKYMKFSSGGSPTQVNWPIPQVVMVTWMANLINGGGSMDYTRDTLTIPDMMGEWMGVCTDNTKVQGTCIGAGLRWDTTTSKCYSTQYFNRAPCQGNSLAWAVQRRTYNSPSTAFNAYQGIMEDMQIIEFNKFAIWNSGAQPTRQQEKDAKLLFNTRMNALGGQITGSPTTAQKKAMIKLLTQPNMDN